MPHRSNISWLKLLCLCSLTLLFFSFSLKHPFYLGVTDLKYNAPQKSLQGTVKLFTNDFEDAIKKVYKVQIDLINGKDKESNNTILKDYLKNHLKIKINGKAAALDLIGYENEAEAVWMYVESVNCALPKKIEIENTLLYDQVKSQINIVHCDVKGNTKSSKVTNPEKSIVFDF
ncbi:MAG: hypothetical protein H0W61_11725 [Bacteroidetes bacterium]|nr:hypothetical protein [Bacteroidota bacterium]